MQPLKGRMAERLGTGLQNPLQRFESASDLINKQKTPFKKAFFVYTTIRFILDYLLLKQLKKCVSSQYTETISYNIQQFSASTPIQF